MSSDLQDRLKLSLVNLSSLIKSAKSSNIDIAKIIASIDYSDTEDDSIILFSEYLKPSSSEQNSFAIQTNSSTASNALKITENFKEKPGKSDNQLKRFIKALTKLQNSNSKISDEIQKTEGFPSSLRKLFEESQECLKKIEKKFVSENAEIKADKHSESTIVHVTTSDYIKNLESQIDFLNIKISKLFSMFGLHETNPTTLPEFSYPDLCNSFYRIQGKFEDFSVKISSLEKKISGLKSSDFLSVWKKYKSYSKDFKITCESPDKPLILILNEIASLSKKETISPCVEIQINDLGSDQKLKEDYEELLVSNLELKSLLINVEGDLTQIRKLETEISALRSKNELLEKVNKELINKKNDSDDSLDLDTANIKDAIEIQELRAALRSLSERYEQEKENLLKDIIESRQDMETQIFRLQNEKNYTEVKLKDTEKIVTDINRDKDRLESIVLTLKKENERLKDSKTFDSKTPGSRRGSSELQNSGDFELTESLEKFAVNSNDLYDILQEELNEIVCGLQENGILLDEGSTVQILRKSSKLLISIKSLIQEENTEKTVKKDLITELKDFIYKSKNKITQLEQEISSKNSVIREKEKKIHEFLKNEHFEIRTEPSPRNSNLDFRPSEKLEVERSKLQQKKHEISLHKEQIILLKKNIRDLQSELEESSKINVMALKENWLQIFKEIPLLSKPAEESLEVFMRRLGFAKQDFLSLTVERKSKNGRKKFSLF